MTANWNGLHPGNTAAGYYYNTYPLPTSSNTASQLLTWDFVNLAPYQCRTIYVDFNTPINMGLMPGMSVVQNVNITPVAGDATPSNNIASLNDSITSSWDPNDKAVYPAGQMSTDEKIIITPFDSKTKGMDPPTEWLFET